jgi:hypothetical protein
VLSSLQQLISSVPSVEGVEEVLELHEFIMMVFTTVRPILVAPPSVLDNAPQTTRNHQKDHGRWRRDGRAHILRTISMLRLRELIKVLAILAGRGGE